MNRGSTPEEECREALARVHAYLDGELEADLHDSVLRHVQECPPCEHRFGREGEIKELLRRSCACTAAPESLRIRVVTRIWEVRFGGSGTMPR